MAEADSSAGIAVSRRTAAHPSPVRQRDPRVFESLVLRHARDWGGARSEPAWRELRPLLDELARMSEVHDFALAFLGSTRFSDPCISE